MKNILFLIVAALAALSVSHHVVAADDSAVTREYKIRYGYDPASGDDIAWTPQPPIPNPLAEEFAKKEKAWEDAREKAVKAAPTVDSKEGKEIILSGRIYYLAVDGKLNLNVRYQYGVPVRVWQMIYEPQKMTRQQAYEAWTKLSKEEKAWTLIQADDVAAKQAADAYKARLEAEKAREKKFEDERPQDLVSVLLGRNKKPENESEAGGVCLPDKK